MLVAERCVCAAATEAVSVVIVAVKEAVCVAIVAAIGVVCVVIVETEVVSVVIAAVREVDAVVEVVAKAHLLPMTNHKFKNVAVVAEEFVEEEILPEHTPLPLQEVVVMVATEKDASTIERAVSEESLHSIPRLQTVNQL